VVLQHVLERADAVVLAGPALQGQRLVPDDVHLGDMRTVPDGFEHAVGQPRTEYGCSGVRPACVRGSPCGLCRA
jgi:hypothetical protein